MLELTLLNGKIFLWKPDDISKLRKEYHIVGSLVGSLPFKGFQNDQKWLPLQLMSEEAKVLMEKGIARLFSRSKEVSESSVSYYLRRKEILCEEQIDLMKQKRREMILEKADEIYEGKKRKISENLAGKKSKKSRMKESNVLADQSSNTDIDSPEEESKIYEQNAEIDSKESDNVKEDECKTLDKETVIQEEIAKIPDISKELCLIQLFTDDFWRQKLPVSEWKFPSSDTQKLRYAVFKDLWEKDFYLTSGIKFGGDFLAYEGDPFKFHALYIIKCLHDSRTFLLNDLITYGRLGNQVKKTVALTHQDEDGNVKYISLSWVPEIL